MLDNDQAPLFPNKTVSTPIVDQQPKTVQQIQDPLQSSRLARLLLIFALLFIVLVTPSVVERVQYSITAAKERAKYDVAKEYQEDLNLNQVSNASRLLANFVGPSVVNVRTSMRTGHGQGSGVIVDDSGYIITNNHVVRGVNSVEIQLSDGRRGSATVVGRDTLLDVAVLKTELENLVAAEWGDSDQLDVGDIVWALGSPFGLQKSITFGILSAKERRGINPGRDSIYQEYLQTDAAVNPGNSGGPLVNTEGQIVGINTAIIGDSYQGISFSIPSTVAKEAYEKLRTVGYVERGYLGVEPHRVSDRMARRLGIKRDEGVLITKVEPNTPAHEAGLQIGDVLISWDGVAYSDPTVLSQAIAGTPIGTRVPVEVLRYDQKEAQELDLEVVVALRPNRSQ